MRTTIRLDDGLLRRAKAQAAASGRSLNDFIADAVRAALALRASRGGAVELPTFRGLGFQPGIDLDDSAALLDVMESEYRGAERKRLARVAARSKPKRRR
ncbi:MAG TPA: YlcI/YnfO family protein [Gemmatimonadales bacterium]|jgi:plasmid stability protein|nr:YlcI/YnfO family protein [Gemmatimonadales bacterium]